MKENFIKLILILSLSLVLWRNYLSIDDRILAIDLVEEEVIREKNQISIEDFIFDLDQILSEADIVEYELNLDGRILELTGSSLDEKGLTLILRRLSEVEDIGVSSINIESSDSLINWVANIFGDFNYKLEESLSNYPRNKSPFYRKEKESADDKLDKEEKLDLIESDDDRNEKQTTVEIKSKNIKIEKPNKLERIEKISEDLKEEHVNVEKLEDYTKISYKNLKGRLDIDLQIDSKDFDYMGFFLYSEENSQAELRRGDKILSTYDLKKGWNAIDYKGDGLPNRLVYQNKSDGGYILIDEIYTYNLDDLNG